jgi:hypothetical protein
MASSKNIGNIHSVHVTNDNDALNVLLCTWHLAVLKSKLDDAANKLSIPVVWSSDDMKCEACGRSHS